MRWNWSIAAKVHKAMCAFIKSDLSTFWNSNFRILHVPFHWRVEWVWHCRERERERECASLRNCSTLQRLTVRGWRQSVIVIYFHRLPLAWERNFAVFASFFCALFSDGRSIDSKIKLRCGNFQFSELCRRFDASDDEIKSLGNLYPYGETVCSSSLCINY